MRRLAILLLLAAAAPAAAATAPLVVRETDVVDRKAVIATVEPAHQLVARARIGGTIASLSVKEGDEVKADAVIAEVTDAKLALQMQALDSRIASQKATRDQAKTDYDRIAELARRGVSTQTQLDQSKTNLDVAERNLAAIKGDRDVIAQQAAEGAVIAPGAGRVLSVPVSVGRVVLPGETIATMAEDKYILPYIGMREGRDDLETHRRNWRALDAVAEGKCIIIAGEVSKECRGLPRRSKEPEVGGDNDAEGAIATDHELHQIVSGNVFDDAPAGLGDAAVSGNEAHANTVFTDSAIAMFQRSGRCSSE